MTKAKVKTSVVVTKTAADVAFRRFLGQLQGMQIWVGIRAGTQSRRAAREQVVIAAANEFGTADGHIPERSFFRATIDRKTPEYLRFVRQLLDRAATTNTLRQGVDVLGLTVVSDIQATIASSVPPPNAPATIARKGSSGTLIDTGRLRQSIDYEIVTGDSRRRGAED